jgi:hypothetical protein
MAGPASAGGRPERRRDHPERIPDEAGSDIPRFPDEGGGEIRGVADYSLVFSSIRDP